MQAATVLGARFTLLEELECDIPGIERHAAHDARLNRRTVVDIVSGEIARTVRKEATRASRLRDPRLARVVATGKESLDGSEVTFVAIEDVPGTSLATILARHRVDPRRAVAIIGGAARALAAARAEGLSHGYLRAGSITVTERGRVVVAGVAIDGAAAAHAGLVPPATEAGDARALAGLLLHTLTGIPAPDATLDDLPDETPATVVALLEDAAAGTGPTTLAAVISALSPFDSRVLAGFTREVEALPLTPELEAELAAIARRAAAQAELEEEARREEQRRLIAAETLAAAQLEAEAAVADEMAAPELRETMHEVDPVTEPVAVVADQVEPDLEPPADKYEAGFDTLEIMVAEQNQVREHGTWELILEAMHRRWPRSQAVTRSLARARERAESGGPLNGSRVVMALAIVGVVLAVMVALAWLNAPLDDSIVIEPDPTTIPNTGTPASGSPSPSPDA